MTNYNLLVNDIQNRFSPTSLGYTSSGNLYRATAIISEVTYNSSYRMSIYDAYKDLLEKLLDGTDNLLSISTTSQRLILSGIEEGTTIYNETKGQTEIYTDNGWTSVSEESNETAITASTTQTQGSGSLSASMNFIETVANKDDTVTLPPVLNGLEISILNHGENTLQIFPHTSDDLGNGTNIPMELEMHETVTFWGKNSTTWYIKYMTESFHGSMYEQDNTTAFVIHAANEAHAYHSASMTAGDLAGWTFNAGSAGASVTINTIADNSTTTTGTILVTTGAAHGSVVSDIICHTGLTNSNYVGFFKILTVPTTTTYTITATYTATGTGFTDRPAYLTPDDIAAGFYNLEWASTMEVSGTTVTLGFDLHDGTSSITGSKDGHKFANSSTVKSLSGLGEKVISSGDKIFFTITNETDATNITLQHFKMRLEHI